MEPQIHACRSVHLIDSWTLSKTVLFGRLHSFISLDHRARTHNRFRAIGVQAARRKIKKKAVRKIVYGGRLLYEIKMCP